MWRVRHFSVAGFLFWQTPKVSDGIVTQSSELFNSNEITESAEETLTGCSLRTRGTKREDNMVFLAAAEIPMELFSGRMIQDCW